MEEPKKIDQGSNFSAIDLGDFDSLTNYTFLHPKLYSEIDGKVFIGELIRSTGSEISFQVMPPDNGISFLHQHKNNEEIYVVIKGSGQFMVDDQIFDIKEGSVIRITPEGQRSWRNNSDMPLVMMCIQVRNKSIENHTVFDGFRSKGEVIWDKK
jgi:mannose-6-phosphate isomerase-like protein (cupin superfamily)